MSIDYVLDDYIDSVESYAENLNKELYSGETSRACAEHIMSWCDLNNHDLASIPMVEYERIFNMYYRDNVNLLPMNFISRSFKMCTLDKVLIAIPLVLFFTLPISSWFIW